jgi:hypothetical protein
MSNRNYLQPNINPTVDPVFKGNVDIEGQLQVTGDVLIDDDLFVTDDSTLTGDVAIGGATVATGLITANGGITIVAPLTLPAASNLKWQQIDGFISSIVSATGITIYIPAKIVGTIVSISMGCSATPTVGSVIATCAIGGAGLFADITNGVLTATTGTTVGNIVTVTPTAGNVIANNDLIRVTISGANTAGGNASIAFRVLVA